MRASDMAIGLLCGTQPRQQESPDVAASTFTASAFFSQRVLRRATRLTPYNLTIGRSPSFAWYRNAKVCTRSIYATLVAAEVDFAAEHADNARVPTSLISARFSFAFVRDPRTRLISCWQNKVVDSNAFKLPDPLREELQDYDRFVLWVSRQDLRTCNKHFRLQSELLDLSNIDFIGRFERFAPDFEHVCSTIGIKAEVEHRNPSSRREPGMAPSTQQLVDELYRVDLENFSY